MEIVLICAVGRNREIGRGGDLVWRISDDLKRFKKITTGHPVIMGRRTYESIGRALPGRTNIVVTGRSDYAAEGCIVADGVDSALQKAALSEGCQRVFVIGGGRLYGDFIERADRLLLTVIDARADDADTWFPEYQDRFEQVSTSDVLEQDGLKYFFAEFVRMIQA